MFGLRAHIVITTCDIFGIRIFFSVPMLWDSTLLSLLVSFINTDFRFSYLLPPGELYIPDDRLIHLKISTITLINSREPTCSSPLQSHTTDKSVWIITSTSRSGNHNSCVLKHRIIPMLLPADAFALFPLLVECRYSHRILCDPSDLFVDYYPT